MPKPHRNGCKNGKQTNLPVQGISDVQKFQVTVDTKTPSK